MGTKPLPAEFLGRPQVPPPPPPPPAIYDPEDKDEPAPKDEPDGTGFWWGVALGAIFG